MTTRGNSQKRKGAVGRQSGQAVVIGAIFMVVLFGFVALSVDVGRVYSERKKLQNATDSAALAGAMELPLSSASDTNYAGKAIIFAETNRVSNAEIQSVEVGHYDPTSETFAAGAAPNDAVRVVARRIVGLTFGPVIGIRTLPVSTHSVAQAFATDSVTGEAVPWVIEFDTNAPPTECQPITLKFKNGTGALSPSETGIWKIGSENLNSGDLYRERVTGGFDGTLSIGDTISLVPGDKTGPTRLGVRDRIREDPNAVCDTVNESSPRIVVVPIVPPGTFAAQSDQTGNGNLTVAGFVSFFVSSTSGQEVTGYFHQIYTGRSVSRRAPSPFTPNTALLVQ